MLENSLDDSSETASVQVKRTARAATTMYARRMLGIVRVKTRKILGYGWEPTVGSKW
uniref:Uncharacterized protein n=1 Tax=Hyaloperonospora arabidopsidis (strain Emoy2) TaxID=559515 RepID=M4BCQ2_HYAAE